MNVFDLEEDFNEELEQELLEVESLLETIPPLSEKETETVKKEIESEFDYLDEEE